MGDAIGDRFKDYERCYDFALPRRLPLIIRVDVNEVVNYLIWRQQDATRNSISMAARAVFSHKECHLKTTPQLLDMLREAGKPWEDTSPQFKRGAVCRPVRIMKPVPQTGEMCERREWRVDNGPPIFSQDRGYVEMLYTAPNDTTVDA